MMRTAWIVVAVSCLVAARAEPRTATTALGDYQIVSWPGGDGITLLVVQALFQDQDGYIWLGTGTGLVRFDGRRFATSNLVGERELPAAATRAIAPSRNGGLWVGYASGRGVYHLVQGEIRAVYFQNELNVVGAILEDRSGIVWVGHDEGLHQIAHGRTERVPLTPEGIDPEVLALHEDRSGTLWLGTSNGLYRRTAAGRFERAPQIDGVVRGISEDTAGHIWITDEIHGFRRIDAPAPRELAGRGMSLFHDREGNLWVATIGQGVWKVRFSNEDPASPIIEVATVERGLLTNEMSGFLEDRDGNLWAGSTIGLHRLTPHKVTSLVDVGVVRGIAFDTNGTAWVGTTTGVVSIAGMRAGSLGRRHTISTDIVRTLHRASDGLWIATNKGLYRLVDGRLFRRSSRDAALTSISSIASDRHGVLWVCDETQGVLRIAGGHVEHVTSADGSSRPTYVYVDNADRLWVAFNNGTIRVVDGDRTRSYGAADGLRQTRIYTIRDDGNGTIWVGGDHGLSRFAEGSFRTLTDQQWAANRPVFAILTDDDGSFWLSVGWFGFVRINLIDLDRAFRDESYRLRYPVYNPAAGTAGLPDTPNAEGAAKGPNGLLWFISGRGLTMLDPHALRDDPEVALGKPHIEGVAADDRWYRATPGTVLPPRVQRLLVDYTVVNVSSFDQIRFRYYLEGFDRNWIDGTGRRQASYTRLRPGRYTFRLQAADLSHDWKDASVEWPFDIEAAFYQTAWFRGMCVLAIGLVVAGVLQLRARQIRRQLAAVLDERIRLSHEVHDTLLQSLVGVALQLNIAAGQVDVSPANTRAALTRMRKQLEEYIREARQSIWTLRSPTLEQRDIVAALREVGERLAASGANVAVNVTGTPRACGPKLETQVLRIAQEAITNAMRHGDAAHVDVHLDFADQLLRLRVSDDGRGFDPKADARVDGHYGMRVMRERAADVGGRLKIESAQGIGSQVTAEFPLES